MNGVRPCEALQVLKRVHMLFNLLVIFTMFTSEMIRHGCHFPRKTIR
jgi:hypothetical protein